MHYTVMPSIYVDNSPILLPDNRDVAAVNVDKIKAAHLMASDHHICQLCGERIQNALKRVYFYGDKETQNFLLCHPGCFRCHVCKTQLDARNYFTSWKRRFYCWRHYDHDGPNQHDNFMRELKNFKKLSVDKTNVLASGKPVVASTVAVHVNERDSACRHSDITDGSEILCDCTNDITGYWLECTHRYCPHSNCYIRTSDKKHFNVTAWDCHNCNRSNTNNSNGDCHGNQAHDVNAAVEHCEEEIYEECFHNQRHSNFYSVDQHMGPIVLSLKHETLRKRPFYRLLLRSASHIIEGLIPVSSFCSPDYDNNAVLDVIAKELDISSSLRPFNDAVPPCKLLLLDKVMLKAEFKVGVLFINNDQTKEEQFFTNTEHSTEFENFLYVLGDKVPLHGFKGYNGGLDTENGLTGKYTIYKEWERYKIMFHVSTMLPMEEHDDQKLQRKRHIGNDIVCVVFLSPGAKFDPSSIKSNFLHVFIIIEPKLINGEMFYQVDVASREFVMHYSPPLTPSKLFKKDHVFQEWLYSKIINGERASYRSPKFASMQERTRKQLLEEVVHDQACKETQPLKFGKNPFQRFLPLRSSFTRSNGSSSPSLQRSVSFSVENGTGSQTDQLRRDLKRSLASGISQYHDVLFLVGKESGGSVPAVRALLAMKSRVFNEMFYPGTPQASRRRISVLSRVSPHHLQQNLKPNKKFPDIWRKTSVATMSTTSTPPPTSSSSVDSLPAKDGERHSNSSPTLNSADVREGYVPPSQLHITEFHISEFSALIEYIHTGSCVIHAHILTGLACAAECYEIHDLKEYCLQCCRDLVNSHTACFMLTSVRTYALRYDIAGRIGEIIISYIEENAADVFSLFDMSSLSDDTFSAILSSNLQLSELSKFDAIKAWHDRISIFGRSEQDFDYLKQSLLAHMDFSKMTVDEITQVSAFFSDSKDTTSSVFSVEK